MDLHQQYKTQLGQTIQNKRQQLGDSMEEVAGNADIATRTLERIELGETSPQVQTLLKIAIALDLSSTAELFEDADSKIFPLIMKKTKEED